MRELHEAFVPDLCERAPGFELRLDLGGEPDDFVGVRVGRRVEAVRGGATLLVADLQNGRMERSG